MLKIIAMLFFSITSQLYAANVLSGFYLGTSSGFDRFSGKRNESIYQADELGIRTFSNDKNFQSFGPLVEVLAGYLHSFNPLTIATEAFFNTTRTKDEAKYPWIEDPNSLALDCLYQATIEKKIHSVFTPI